MKKISVAVALYALSTGALAQSAVTLYGLLDSGIRVDRTNAGTLVSVPPGMGSGSRFGFRGSEDLGGGFRALFVLEGGFGVDTGASGQGGLLFGRRAIVGLNGGFGTIAFGREYSPLFFASLDIDPVQYGTVANIFNIYRRVVIRINNSVNYVTPNWGGFEGRLTYAPGETNAAGIDKSSGNQFGGSVKWAGGPVLVNYAYQQNKGTTNVAPTPKEEHHMVGGSFKFGPMTAYASYATFEDDAPPATRVDFANTWAALKGEFGVSTVALTFGQINDKAATNRDARLMALAYSYRLSRRTDLHAAVARMTNKTNGQFLIFDSTSTGLQNTANVPVGFDPTAFGIGLRHTF